jgi:hypothetical protein
MEKVDVTYLHIEKKLSLMTLSELEYIFRVFELFFNEKCDME